MTFKDWFTQETDRDLADHVKRVSHISMDPDRRAKMRADLAEYARMRPVRVAASGRVHKRGWFALSLHPIPIITTLLVVAVGTGSAGAATLAQSALPGDLLYPIKINVNEEVKAAFAVSPAAKAEVAIARAETRIKEIEQLEARGTLDEDTQAKIDARLDAHVHAAEERAIETDDDNGDRVEREERLVAVLRAHETLLVGIGIGGATEPDISVSAVARMDGGVEIDAQGQPPAPGAATMMMAVSEEDAGEVEDTNARVMTQGKMSDAEEENTARTQDSRLGERVVARQMRAAEYRIKSLEQLLKRSEKYVSTETLAVVQADLSAAQEAYDEGETLFEDEQFTDASVRFNAAMRIAINAREMLSQAPRTNSRSSRESKAETEKNEDNDTSTRRDTNERVTEESRTEKEETRERTESQKQEDAESKDTPTTTLIDVSATATTIINATTEIQEETSSSTDEDESEDENDETEDNDRRSSFIKNFFRIGL